MKWSLIIIAILVVIIFGYFGVKVWCHYIETDIAYSHPMIKYVRKSAKVSTITIHSDTKVNIAKSDRIQLLPDGSYTFFNPTDIVLSSSTSVTNHSTEETTENGTSKPILPKNASDFVLTLCYVHIDHQPDLQAITCYRRVIGDLYMGVGVYTRADMFADGFAFSYGWQNITVGIAYIF